MQKYKICVYAICKNEEKFAEAWMESVKEADMVVVLDTGSTDRTVSILKNAGAEVQLLPVATADADVLASDVVLFGCPAMGSEELEEGEFEPFFSSVESGLSGKRVGLFGSYDWGDGEWMRSWQARVVSNGGVMIEDGIIANNTPDDAALSACRALGEKAAK